jgi:hypothetical protein
MIRGRLIMEIRVTCKGCGKPFEVVGEGRGMESSRPATCCYCQEVNDITWPVMGTYFVRAVPEYMEWRLDAKAILDEQEKAAGSGKK